MTREGCWYHVLCDEYEEAAEYVSELAQRAWHPVSEPPTEADGDEEGFVATWDGSKVDFQFWDVPKEYWGCRYWARIKDVVLIPGDF